MNVQGTSQWCVSSPKIHLPTLRSSVLGEIKDTNETLINLQDKSIEL